MGKDFAAGEILPGGQGDHIAAEGNFSRLEEDLAACCLQGGAAMEVLAGVIAENGKDAGVAARGNTQRNGADGALQAPAHRLSMQGLRAASMGVLPPNSSRGVSAMPSPMTKRYFMGCLLYFKYIFRKGDKIVQIDIE